MSEVRNDKKNISRHILPTSANLLGLCFVILSFIKLSKTGHETIIDEIVTAAIVLFFISSFFSYVSMRSERLSQLCEKIADSIFLIGLFLLSIGSVLVAYEAIR
jgi:predicted membrane channel-forming protein YqfA (hemolysin III family)